MSILPWARLLRVPNVFTALADIAVGAAVAVGLEQPEEIADFSGRTLFLFIATGLLYMSGMVWNDIFDLAEDRRDRPFRPLPSRRISIRSALIVATLLTIGGLAACFRAGSSSAQIGMVLAVAILAYDARIKRTRFGPIGMGLCRFLNILLGLSLISPDVLPDAVRYHLALTVGAYIVGVTWFARTEEKRSRPDVLAAAAVLMTAAVLSVVALPSHPIVVNATLFLPYLVALFLLWWGRPVLAAVRDPKPNRVQAAVKRSIFGLIVLDALLATCFVNLPGLILIALLAPAVLLGKWVYST